MSKVSEQHRQLAHNIVNTLGDKGGFYLLFNSPFFDSLNYSNEPNLFSLDELPTYSEPNYFTFDESSTYAIQAKDLRELKDQGKYGDAFYFLLDSTLFDADGFVAIYEGISTVAIASLPLSPSIAAYQKASKEGALSGSSESSSSTPLRSLGQATRSPSYQSGHALESEDTNCLHANTEVPRKNKEAGETAHVQWSQSSQKESWGSLWASLHKVPFQIREFAHAVHSYSFRQSLENPWSICRIRYRLALALIAAAKRVLK